MPGLLHTLRARLERGDPIGPAPGPGKAQRDSFIAAAKAGQRPRPAAVLIPILLRPRALTILFTQRHAALKEHAGQISFPGGRRTAGDKSLLETALREAEEEIGLPRPAVSVLGALSPYRTSTLYDVTPFVAVVTRPFVPRLDPREVEGAFEAPVAFFLEKDSLRVVTREDEGRRRTFFAYDVEGRRIWGATAAILAALAAALRAYAGEGRE